MAGLELAIAEKRFMSGLSGELEVEQARINLLDADWKISGPFDVIFCRNVMIYFDKPTQEQLVRRYYDVLAPQGYLFIGHSESLTGVQHDFEYVQPTVYQKP